MHTSSAKNSESFSEFLIEAASRCVGPNRGSIAENIADRYCIFKNCNINQAIDSKLEVHLVEIVLRATKVTKVSTKDALDLVTSIFKTLKSGYFDTDDFDHYSRSAKLGLLLADLRFFLNSRTLIRTLKSLPNSMKRDILGYLPDSLREKSNLVIHRINIPYVESDEDKASSPKHSAKVSVDGKGTPRWFKKSKRLGKD